MSTSLPTGLFVHHVFFWLKNPDSESDKAKLLEGLNTLIDIPGYLTAHIGFPADTHREVIDRSYAVSWLLLFHNGEEEATYQTHPIHVKFVEEYAHLWERVVVYDSEGPKIA